MLNFLSLRGRWLPYAAVHPRGHYYYIRLMLILVYTHIVNDISIDIEIEIGTIELVCLAFCSELWVRAVHVVG